MSATDELRRLLDERGEPVADSRIARRIDALERRIERLDGMLDGMGKGAASRIEAMEGRVAAMERKLNHKGGDA